MPSITPSAKTLYSATIAATTNTGTLTLQVADVYTFAVVCGTVTGTSPTLDVVFQNSPDGGTTWVNMPLRTAQLTATAAANYFTIPQGRGTNMLADSSAVAATGGILSENFVMSNKFRFLLTVGGTNPSFPVSIYQWTKTFAN